LKKYLQKPNDDDIIFLIKLCTSGKKNDILTALKMLKSLRYLGYNNDDIVIYILTCLDNYYANDTEIYQKIANNLRKNYLIKMLYNGNYDTPSDIQLDSVIYSFIQL
jgi:hypothetical protein